MLALAMTACAPESRPLIAEVYYDAAGDDSGYEYVEILNPADSRHSLAGVRLEAGDGAGAGRWTLRWTGAPGDSIAAGARFVVGGARVDPAPDRVVTLDLQNGPDAVRLVWPDGAIEVVGYGALESPEYFCGEPAADAASGMALARIPDDARLGSNALDFRPAAPSPGRANRPRRDAGWVQGSLALDPVQPTPGEPVRLLGRIANAGVTELGAGDARLVVTSVTADGALALRDEAFARPLGAGDSSAVELAIALPAGKQTLVAALVLPGDENAGNDRDSLRVRAGDGALEITEIQFHPAAGEGEWVELKNRGDRPLALADFTLSDRGAGRGRPQGADLPCPPESLVVLAQDRVALLARYPEIDAARVWQVSPWSSLNNSDDASGVADAVVVREGDGTQVARRDYSAAGVLQGVPIELRDGGWWPALDPRGTPLASPRVPAPIAGRFELEPRRIAVGQTTRLAWALPWTRARVAFDVYDLAGSRVMRCGAESAVAGRGEQSLAAPGLAPGLYLVVMRARADAESLTATRVLRVDGAAP